MSVDNRIIPLTIRDKQEYAAQAAFEFETAGFNVLQVEHWEQDYDEPEYMYRTFWVENDNPKKDSIKWRVCATFKSKDSDEVVDVDFYN